MHLGTILLREGMMFSGNWVKRTANRAEPPLEKKRAFFDVKIYGQLEGATSRGG